MQAVLKSEVEDSYVLHDDVLIKLEPPDSEMQAEFVIELYPYHEVKEEIVIGPVVLQESEEQVIGPVVLQESEEHPVLHDEVQVKLECADRKTEAELTEELYPDHEIKGEVVIGPVVLQTPGLPAELVSQGPPLPKKPRLNKEKQTKKAPPAKGNDDAVTEENISETVTPKSNVEFQTTKSAKHRELIFKSKTLMKKTHTDNCLKTNEPFTFNNCQRNKTKSTLIQHIKIHNKNNTKLYFNCTECEYTTVTQDTLEKHLKLHDKQRQHVCEICSFRFETKQTLRLHMKGHTVSKRYSCEICKKFKTNNYQDLERHLRVHSGEKPFTCPQCDYKCTRQDNLERHLRTHTGEKPFTCPQCLYICMQKDVLKIHLRTHTGEKPFSCPQCEYKCTQGSHLKSHISRKHSKV